MTEMGPSVSTPNFATRNAAATAEGDVWHVADVSCQVFEERDLNSRVCFVLPKGTYITVLRSYGNWLEMASPVAGWCTVTTNSGQQVLYKGNFEDLAKFRYKVVCRTGAFVREGLELGSPHIRTIPTHEIVEVHDKRINMQGLTRLFVGDGWISEQLNPLSGQRGPIVELLPMPSPVRYRVVFPEGCVVRTGVELSSFSVRTIPFGEEIVVAGKAWSESPPLQRLRLSNAGGWVSLKLNKPHPGDVPVVVPVGPVTDQIPALRRLGSDDDPNQPMFPELDNPAPVRNSDDLSLHGEKACIVCLESPRNATLVHGETGHVACCLECARILKGRGDSCPVCRVPIDRVIQHFVA